MTDSKKAAHPKTTMTTSAHEAAARKRVDDDGEGEPQTKYLNPPEGGSYTRHADGSLTRTQRPTKVPETAPIDRDAAQVQEVEERPMVLPDVPFNEARKAKE
jgi:hypothetical protein